MESNFETIRKEGRLLIEFIRGSQLYGLSTPLSDVDTGGVFIAKPEEVLGMLNYRSQVSDPRHDNTWYELGEFIKLGCKSNPTVLEALFVPEDKIIGEVHPWFKLIRDNRDKFISKQCFNPFFGYAKSQIVKAKGLKKKIWNPIEKRLTPIDFCYLANSDGGTDTLLSFLEKKGLKQEYCGIIRLNHMRDTYNLYYDWGAHVQGEESLGETFKQTLEAYGYIGSEPFGYRGIICKDDGNELRLSEIPVGEQANFLCTFSYNASHYSEHCREYKEYKEWEKNRNPVRYSTNLKHNVDSKNMLHCFRLIHMAKEIAQGKGIILERSEDKDFLMNVRNNKYEYEELMEMLDKETKEMNEVMEKSTIPDNPDVEFINDLLIKIRLEQIQNKR